jgi:hypothetical protein
MEQGGGEMELDKHVKEILTGFTDILHKLKETVHAPDFCHRQHMVDEHDQP